MGVFIGLVLEGEEEFEFERNICLFFLVIRYVNRFFFKGSRSIPQMIRSFLLIILH